MGLLVTVLVHAVVLAAAMVGGVRWVMTRNRAWALAFVPLAILAVAYVVMW